MGGLHRSISEAPDRNLHASCWSHARRKFVDSIPENDKNSKAAKAVEIIDRAFALEREARKANYSPEKILEMRQKEVRPIIEEFYNFIGTLRPSKDSHLGAAVTYALNQKDKLLLFLDHPEIEMTNDLAERTVKAIPHRACAEDALSDFSSDCIEIPQAYYRMLRDFCAR